MLLRSLKIGKCKKRAVHAVFPAVLQSGIDLPKLGMCALYCSDSSSRNVYYRNTGAYTQITCKDIPYSSVYSPETLQITNDHDEGKVSYKKEHTDDAMCL